MRAKLFFRVFNHGQEIRRVQQSTMLAEFCDIAAVSGNLDNYKNVKERFLRLAYPETAKRKALKLEDPNSARIIGAALKSIAHLVQYNGRR